MDLAKIEGDEIVIRIKIAGLGGAAFQGFEQVGCDEPEGMDLASLAPDLVMELNAESDDGTTLIHTALDAAVVAASENGSEAFSYLDE